MAAASHVSQVPPESSKVFRSFYQKANHLGSVAVKEAPRATATALAVAPLALHLFQPEGILTQMLTLGLTTGVVLNAPHIYKYVYNHPFTTAISEQPFVQQIAKHPVVLEGTAKVSSAIHDVSAFASKVKWEINSRLFPQAEEEPTSEEERAEIQESEHKRERTESPSVFVSQLNTLKQAFRAVPTATGATLAVNALALQLFQPEGLITQFFTLTAASASFFTTTKFYARYHSHPLVLQLTNHPAVVKGAKFASQIIDTTSAFYAHVRAFPPKKQEARQSLPTGELPSYAEFRQSLIQSGMKESWEGVAIKENVIVPEDHLRPIYNAVMQFLRNEEEPSGGSVPSSRHRSRGAIPPTDGSLSAAQRRRTSATDVKDR